MNMKKLLSLLLVIAMLVSLFPAALAEGEDTASDDMIAADEVFGGTYDEEPEDGLLLPDEDETADEVLTEVPTELSAEDVAEPAEEPEELLEAPAELPEEAVEAPEEEAEEPVEETPEEEAEAAETEDPEEPDDEEPSEEEAEPVQVNFVSEQDITLTVFAGETAVDPVEDAAPADDTLAFRAVYLLVPGVYTYTAEAEGFVTAKDVPFEVAAGSEPLSLTVTLKEGLPYGFRGMPEGYEFTEAQLAEKRILTDEGILAAVQSGGEYVEGELLFSADTEEYANLVAEAYNAELAYFTGSMGKLYLTEATVAEAVECAADLELPLPAVEPNWIIHQSALMPSAGSWFDTEMQAAYSGLMWQDWIDNTPNPDELMSDPGGAYQYHHDIIHSYGAWGVTTGKSGVVVAVLDSGVDGTADLAKVQGDTGDVSGHGTAVAGLIAGTMGNGAEGAGVAPNAGIYSMRVLDENGNATAESIAKAIGDAYKAARIINLNFNSLYYSSAIETAIKNAKDAVIIVPMGDDGTNIKTYPAASSLANVIAVGATDISGARAPFSNYGKWCDISAPGAGIWSSAAGGGTACYDGTAMSAAIVTGVAALYMSKNGSISAAALTNKKMVSKGPKDMGSGIIDAALLFGATKGGAYPKVFNSKNEVITGSSVPANGYIQLESGSGDTGEGSRFLYSTDGQSPAVLNGEVIHGSDIRELGHYDAEKGCFILPLESFTPGQTVEFRFMELNGFGAAGEVSKLELVITEAETADQEKAAEKAKVGSIVLTGELPVFAVGTTTVLPVEVRDTEGKALSLKDAAITWSSSDPSVATIAAVLNEKSGEYEVRVTARKEGSFQLSGKEDGESEARIDIQANAQILIKTIVVTGQTVAAPGTTANYKVSMLDPKNAKNKKLNWKIGDENGQEKEIPGITAKTGKVTVAKDAIRGTVFTVWAVSTDGSNVESNKITVIVDNKAGAVEISQGEKKLKNNDTIKLCSVNLPGTEQNDRSTELTAIRVAGSKTGPILDSTVGAVQWTSNKPDIVRIDNDNGTGVVTITAHKAGTATLTAKANDGSPASAKLKVQVTVPVSSVTIVSASQDKDFHDSMSGAIPIAYGKSVKNTAVLGSTYGTPTNKKVNWSLKLLELDKNGNETGKTKNPGKYVAVKNGTLSLKAGQAEKDLGYNYIIRVTASIDGVSNTIDYRPVALSTKLQLVDETGKEPKQVVFGTDPGEVSRTLYLKWTYKYFVGNVAEVQYLPSFSVTSTNPDIAGAKLEVLQGDRYRCALTIYPNTSGTGKPGTAKITVKTTDGSNKSVSINVKVDKNASKSQLNIVTQPTSLSVPQEQEATFSVEAKNAKSFQWQIKQTGKDYWWNVADEKEKISGATSNTLTIWKSASSDSGQMYRCVVSDGNGFAKTSDEVSLTVFEKYTVTIPSQTYTGKELEPAVTVEVGVKKLIEGTDYEVKLPEDLVNAGDHTVTISGKGKYGGKAEATFTIDKAANPMTYAEMQTVSKTYSSSAQTATLAAAANGQGNVTYDIKSQKDSAKADVTWFTLNGTTLTLAAKTPAGTYTVVVSATAAGNSNYESGTKDSTVTVTVGKADNPMTYAETQTVSKTYSSSAQTATLAAAENGEGTVSYDIKSQKDSAKADVTYFTLNGTTLTLAADTPAGTYTVVVSATAAGNSNYNSGTKDSTVTVTVQQEAVQQQE